MIRYLVPFAFVFQSYAVPANLGNSPLAYNIGADIAFILQNTQDGGTAPCSVRPRYIIEALSLALAVFPRCGDIPPEQLPGNLRRCGSLGSPPKDQTDNISHILVNLHTSVCAFPVPIGANFALVLATLHFCVFSGFCLDRHIPAVALTDKILKGHVNTPGVSLEIDGVKIVTDRDKPRMVQGEYPLNEISGLNAVTAKAGKVFKFETKRWRLGRK